MPRSLSKYRLGLGAIGLLTLGLLVFVITQAGATKQDATTYTQANKAANKLNNYTDTNNSIPDSLKAAGAGNLSKNLSYYKVSDTAYKFCETYKAASSGFDASTVEQNLVMGVAGQGGGSDNTYQGNYTSLYIPFTHHKGQNCQTIKPYLYNSGGTSQPVYTPLAPSTSPTPVTPTVSKEELSKPPARRPVQYVHVCTDSANITYVSQGTPQCLPGGTFSFDYDPSVPGTYYSIPCQTTGAATLRYVYISAGEACPSGTAAVN